MDDFAPLALALATWFESDLVDLPDELRQRVVREFSPLVWGELSAEQRRTVASQLDYHQDPAMDETRAYWWDFHGRMDGKAAEIAAWDAAKAPTVGELVQREARLPELRQELALMVEQARAGPDAVVNKLGTADLNSLPVPREGDTGTACGLNLSDAASSRQGIESPLTESVERPVQAIQSPASRSQIARTAANALHDRPGGSREKKMAIRAAWASGKYKSRDICAEQECAGLNMAISTARRALKGTPEPDRQ